MKRLFVFVLLASFLVSCNKNDKEQHSYSTEFLAAFTKDKNSILSRQNLVNEQSDMLDIMTLEGLQSGAAYNPFIAELIVMNRNMQSLKSKLFQDCAKMHQLNDDITAHRKDQPTVEKEWLPLKKSINETIDVLQDMTSQNQSRFMEFAGKASGNKAPAGPLLPPPPVR